MKNTHTVPYLSFPRISKSREALSGRPRHNGPFVCFRQVHLLFLTGSECRGKSAHVQELEGMELQCVSSQGEQIPTVLSIPNNVSQPQLTQSILDRL